MSQETTMTAFAGLVDERANLSVEQQAADPDPAYIVSWEAPCQAWHIADGHSPASV